MDDIRQAELPEAEIAQPQEIKKKWMIVRMTIASIGAFCGLLVMIAFIYPWQFWNTVAFGAITGIIASITLLVHIGWYRRFWQRQRNAYKKLSALMLLGCFSQLLGICGMCVYITLATMLHQDLNLVYGVDNYWMATTWSFMTLKYGSGLFWFSRSYRRLIKNTEDNRPLTR